MEDWEFWKVENWVGVSGLLCCVKQTLHSTKLFLLCGGNSDNNGAFSVSLRVVCGMIAFVITANELVVLSYNTEVLTRCSVLVACQQPIRMQFKIRKVVTIRNHGLPLPPAGINLWSDSMSINKSRQIFQKQKFPKNQTYSLCLC